VFRVNNNDIDDNCDEMRDGGSNARDEVIRDEREHNININECNARNILFQIQESVSMEEVLAKSPWIVSNKPIFVQKWDPIIGMKKVDVTKISVWVKLINIPMEAWSKEGISAMASSLGKPLRMDNTTAQICKDGKGRAEYARGTKKIKVEDLWKPNTCSQCKIFGHSDTRCRKNQNLNVGRNQVAPNSREHAGEKHFTEEMCFCSFVYASNNGYEKRQLWNDLEIAKGLASDNPCLFGDFNVTLKVEEHSMEDQTSMGKCRILLTAFRSEDFPLPKEVPTASEESSPWSNYNCNIVYKDSLSYKKSLLVIVEEMDQQNPTIAKIPILETGKLKQWQFRIQQYLQHEHYALWEVIEFGDSYEAPKDDVTTASASDGTGKKKGRTVTLTTDDMQKRKNDVKTRTTLLLALHDAHQLRFSKHKTAQELWATILKTFGGNEATKKTKKNLLKQLYGNFKAEGSKTLEQILASEWLMHTIVWKNMSDLDTMSLDDLYNHLKVYESEVQKKSKLNFQNMAFISSAKHNNENEKVNTASVYTASTNVFTASANIGAASISQDTAYAYIASQSSGKKITIQGTDVAGFDKSKIECFNCHKMGHFDLKAWMAIDGVGWDWSYMENDEDNHALVADEEAPIEFSLMTKTSVESEVFDNSLCSEACKKNTDSLNRLSQVEARLAEHINQEVKYYEKIRVLEFKVESRANCIKSLTKELELIKKEKEGLDSKLAGFQTAFKDLDNLLESQKSDKNKEELGYSDVPPSRSSPHLLQKAADRPTENKTDKGETVKKHAVKYAEHSRKPSKKLKQLEVPTARNMPPRPAIHKTYRPLMRPNMNDVHPNRTSFYKPSHSYTKFQRTSAVRSQFRGPRVPVSRSFSTVNRKFPTGNRKFPTGNTKFSTADMGMKGNAVKASAAVPRTTLMTKAIGTEDARLLANELSKPIKLEFENVYFVKDLKDFKLIDDANMLLMTPRQHNMHSINLNNIVPHKDLSCLVAKASADECMLWHKRPGHLNYKTMNRCDIGEEFRNKEIDDFCSQKKIKREFSNAMTPQQNGVAERRNRTLIEAARTMLADAKLPRTKRVEENLHVDFLENKAIEKGTNSTNFSDTNDAAGQEVKKDVSSLRYIALPEKSEFTGELIEKRIDFRRRGND
nr:hypothetical protein [Tanacetum cinerariifolium]